jgi:protein gp37
MLMSKEGVAAIEARTAIAGVRSLATGTARSDGVAVQKHGTSIEWTHGQGYKGETWNPATGCSKRSPGCAHCYAESLTLRFAETWGAPKLPWTPANAAKNVILHPERLDQPLRWRKPRMVFVNSMSDLFHEQVPSTFIYDVFSVMRECPQHIFQILTKRPDRMVAELRGLPLREFWPHVWLGTSIENRRFVDRADWLRLVDPAVRFISAEPLLGPLVERITHGRHCGCSACARQDWSEPQLAPCGMHGPSCPPVYSPRRSLNLAGIDWLIVGGESGRHHRPVHEEWVRDLQEAADRAGTPFFFKQWGGRTPKAGGRELDGRIWDEMPRLREGGVR